MMGAYVFWQVWTVLLSILLGWAVGWRMGFRDAAKIYRRQP